LGPDFFHASRGIMKPTQLPVQWVSDSFPEVKRPVGVVDDPTTSSAQVKERVELCLDFPLGLRGLF